MIQIRKLKKLYGKRVVLNVADYYLAADRIHLLAGHNGAGKTTLMRIINGLESPTEGTVECALRKRDMVFCAQKPYMFNASVQRNVEYGLRARNLAHVAPRATQMLDRLGIAHLAHQQARHLSSGEIQKVALARALVLEPQLLLLDEPFANLDDNSRGLVEDELLEQLAKGRTIIIATHLLPNMHHITADVTLMEHGRILGRDATNIFEGVVTRKDSHTFMQVTQSLSIAVATELQGAGRGALLPEDIVLSLRPIESSMRNCFYGKVVGIKSSAEHVEIIVDIGIKLTTRITPESADEMLLKPGKEVYAAFKATAVKVYSVASVES
jgi:molybdate/tungstate transport system ATP-binding protein